MNFSFPLGACAAAALIALLAGCASTDDKSAPEFRPAREMRTGSNLPVEDPAPPKSQEERDRTAEQIRSLQRTGGTGKPAG